MVVGVLLAVTLSALPAVPSSPASALSGSEFNPGNIISDANFYNGSAMSETEIQRFLEAAVGGSCQNSNCLAVYRADTPTRTWSFGTCSTYVGGTGESAARIIFKVQQACNLSAKVILVTLQKEQSLVTDRAPSDGVMRKAMGYGCPDTSACDSTYYGFFNQLFAAGRQLTWYGNPEGSFTSIRVGAVNAIRYHPNAGCGSKDVLIQNRATAALYYYTPYTPNAAALANLGGIGDACSAYGNRNFWVFYHDWFGDPSGARVHPFGNVELIAAQPGSFRVVGWAADPDSPSPISVHVYVGSVGTAYAADRTRADVGAAHPELGSQHGFDVTVPARGVSEGRVCVYAMNVGPGAPVLLTCADRTPMSGPPIGNAPTITTTNSTIEVSGWALDPDVTTAIPVHVYVGAVGTATTASRPATLPSSYNAYGSSHGYAVSLPAAAGQYNVCVYGINTGPGGHTLFECRTVVVGSPAPPDLKRAPIGNVETVRPSTSGIDVVGWALDPDTRQSIQVHAYVDGVGTAFAADLERADVGRLYPLNGSAHGFAKTVPAEPGQRNVCLYAINTGPGGHTLLNCTVVMVGGTTPGPDRGRAPIGNVESVRATAGGVEVAGWALDPDTNQSIQVHVYVDGSGIALTADLERADVGRLYPLNGSAHGFAKTVPAEPGQRNVCVYAINTGPGGHTLLNCTVVTVTDPPTEPDLGRAPIGNVETLRAVAGGVEVGGWALDPDTSQPIQVHVYVDAAGTAITANLERGDVGRAFPAAGAHHGFVSTVPAGFGQHRVCVYGINTGAGGHTLLRCGDVVVP